MVIVFAGYLPIRFGVADLSRSRVYHESERRTRVSRFRTFCLLSRVRSHVLEIV